MGTNGINSIIEWLNFMKDDFFLSSFYPFDWHKAEEFLKKYWIPKDEFLLKWQPIQNVVFRPNVSLSNYLFNKRFNLIGISNAGGTFYEQEYICFQQFLKEIGEKHFIIAENADNRIVYSDATEEFLREGQKIDQKDNQFRFKFPIDTPYEELNSGGIISEIFLDGRYPKDYYIFGESVLWGKYAENLYYDLYFLGFEPVLTNIAKKCYSPFLEESKKLAGKISSEIHKEQKIYGRLEKYLPKIIW
jgi:hypothetical protein